MKHLLYLILLVCVSSCRQCGDPYDVSNCKLTPNEVRLRVALVNEGDTPRDVRMLLGKPDKVFRYSYDRQYVLWAYGWRTPEMVTVTFKDELADHWAWLD